jgi:nucleoside phosphorylase
MNAELVPGLVTGGTVPVSSTAYVNRAFENELFDVVTTGNWAVLVGPRQHGKSSALARLYVRLQENGFSCALVDLQAYGADDEYDAFLGWICERIAQDVGSETTAPRRRDDLRAALDSVLPERFANVVVLLDEVSAVPGRLQHRFFGQLRALFNARGLASTEEIPWRVGFVFAGTFRPEAMVDGDNSPFNISQFILSSDLSLEDVRGLARSVDGDAAERCADRAYDLVGGQPYLAQVLLAGALRDSEDADRGFDNAEATIREGSDRHLPSLLRKVTEDSRLRVLAERVLEGAIPFNGADDDHRYARIVGIAGLEDGKLVLRNKLYAEALEATLNVEDTEVQDPESAGVQAPDCDVLMVTTTALETAAVRDVFGAGEDPGSVFWRNNVYAPLGTFGDAAVVLMQAQAMGTIGPGAATLAVSEAIQWLHPTAVVMVGICFGVDQDGQSVGDVIVTRELVGYESVRVSTEEESGDQLTESRARRVEATPRLVARFQAAEGGFAGRVRVATMLSGEKLVDNLEFRLELQEAVPDAKGGEMEAMGVYAAAVRENTDWIVVKAICDFADGSKGENEAFNQGLAAAQAAQFVRHTIEAGGFGR